MKQMYAMTVAALGFLLVGCATTSQVQEMIDASNRDYQKNDAAQQNSIEILKKSSLTALEKTKSNSESLSELKAQLDTVLEQLKLIQGYADAAKIMSAANTVKVSDLSVAVDENRAFVDDAIEQKEAVDKLHEEVLMRHCQMLIDSANSIMETLTANGVSASSAEPVELDEPIEIVAPDTSGSVDASTSE
jgi:hypothetical protein